MLKIRNYNVCLIASGVERKKTKLFYNDVILPCFPDSSVVNCDVKWIKNSNLDILKNSVERADLIICIADKVEPFLYFALGIAFSSDKSALMIYSSSLQTGSWISNYDKIKMIESDDLFSLDGIDNDDMQVVKNYLNQCYLKKTAYVSMFDKLWFRSDVKKIHIIVAAEVEKPTDANIESHNYGFMDNLSDKDAIFQIVKLLSGKYPLTEISLEIASDFDTKQMSDNLVIIGGPGGAEYEIVPGTVVDDEGNRICRRISDMMGSNIAYTADCEKMLVNGESYEAEFNDKLMTSDFGYFAALNNPYNPENRIILIHGIHTLGVAGAAQAFSTGQIVEANFEVIGQVLEENNADEISFESFFQVDVIKGAAMVPRVKKDNVFLVKKLGSGSVNTVRNMNLPEVSQDDVLKLKNLSTRLFQEIEKSLPEMKASSKREYSKTKEWIIIIAEIISEIEKEGLSKERYIDFVNTIKDIQEKWDD